MKTDITSLTANMTTRLLSVQCNSRAFKAAKAVNNFPNFPLRISKRVAVVRADARDYRNTVQSTGSTDYIKEEGFKIERISFGSILTPVGVSLLVYGFGAFFQMLPGGDVSSLLLIYGFPITLLGFALSYAQLEPVPCLSTPEAIKARELQATDIQKQVREDVTRYRYGDEQHLDEALNRIFRFGQAGGIPRRLCPILKGIREEIRDGSYTLVLEFSTDKERMTDDIWETRKDKFQSFFGPGIIVEVMSTSLGEDVALICDGSGAGREGAVKKDVLPPLMPGMKPRQQS